MRYWWFIALLSSASTAVAEVPAPFAAKDVFELEWISGVDVSPDRERILFIRNGFDATIDRERSNFWMAFRNGAEPTPLLSSFEGGQLGPARYASRKTRGC